MPIRKAIKQVLRTAFIAKESRNKELYLECRGWLQAHLHQRHTGKFIFTQQ